jgi:ABC-type transport system substrate-binding protein
VDDAARAATPVTAPYFADVGTTPYDPAKANALLDQAGWARGWCNQTAQRAMDAFFGHYQQSQRTADIKIVMQEFVKDVPSVVSALRVDLFAYNKDLKNYTPNNVTPFDNMMNVDI